MAHIYNEILCSNKNKYTIHAWTNLDESPDNHAERKQPIPRGYILYGSAYITFLNDNILEMITD